MFTLLCDWSKRLSVAKYLELNRRFANGIAKTSNEKKLQELLEEIRKYNADRRVLSISDRQVFKTEFPLDLNKSNHLK